MAAITTQAYTSLQSYWRRRAYQRLEGTSTSKRTARLGGSSESRRKRRSLKVGFLKKVFRVRVRISSPKKLLLRMRDAYVNAMLVFAGGVPPAKREVRVKARDFEMKLMLHIYNTLLSTPRELTSCA